MHQYTIVYTLSSPDCSSAHSWAILFRPCNILQRFVSDCAINVYQPNLCWRTADKRDLDILLAESRGCVRIPIRRVADLGSIYSYMVKRSDHVRSQVQEGDFMLIQWWCGHCCFACRYNYRVLPVSSNFFQPCHDRWKRNLDVHARAWSSVSPPHRSSEQLFCVFGKFMFNPLCHNFIQPFCNVFSNPTTSHSMQNIALKLFSILQPSFCKTTCVIPRQSCLCLLLSCKRPCSLGIHDLYRFIVG